ncbi:hypothetical protein FRC06_001401 [Ceratobasidium sp. 370]|nr:hypothetical protein FRC06_001401 [Ceratobasidium sp. 370]
MPAIFMTPKLKLTFLDKVAKRCGKVVAPPEPIPAPAPAPAPAPVTGVLGDAAVLTALLNAFAAVTHPAPPAAPAPVPDAPLAPAPAQTATLDNKNDHLIDFPTVGDWIESIADVFPHLNRKAHVGVLEEHGFTHVNNLVMAEVTPWVLTQVTKIKFVDATVLIRKAKEIVQEMCLLPM